MRILAIDIGTGTQDILLFDTSDRVENSAKIVAPSPTMRVAEKVRDATMRRRSILFTGVTMGGGPCTWALQQHLKAGLRAFATPDAARTFDDDLDVVAGWGLRIVAEDEAARIHSMKRIELRDSTSTPSDTRSHRSVSTRTSTVSLSPASITARRRPATPTVSSASSTSVASSSSATICWPLPAFPTSCRTT